MEEILKIKTINLFLILTINTFNPHMPIRPLGLDPVVMGTAFCVFSALG